MGRDEWFRNAAWSDEVEAAFFKKLRRARRKAQYLRIQASTLASSRPEIALRLLNDYFALGEDFDHAQGHVDRAHAYTALKNIDAAILSFEAAIAHEDANPRVLTCAYLELPRLVAIEKRSDRYDSALQTLTKHKNRLIFPSDHYNWHGAKALILYELGRASESRTLAQQALEAAGATSSGFRHHPNIGLVDSTADEFGLRLRRIAGKLR